MINVIQIGVGPLGQKVVKYMLAREGIRIVGAVDSDPEKAGKDLGTVCGLDTMNIRVQKKLDDVSAIDDTDVAVVTTLSSLEQVESQLLELASAGLNIVSTCEELSYPWQSQAKVAQRIDTACMKNRVSCVGTGVNPGFLMDYLPAVLSSVCQRVQRVHVKRVQDASSRRIPFQQKIGAGLTIEEFGKKKEEGTLRHVGLEESIYMIAAALNRELDYVEESLEMVIAEEPIATGYTKIEKGKPRGVEQVGTGFQNGEEVIKLYFKAAVGEPESFDEIQIKGTPTFTSRIAGGVNGDIATSAITINAIKSAMKAAPGLKTMLDISVPSSF